MLYPYKGLAFSNYDCHHASAPAWYNYYYLRETLIQAAKFPIWLVIAWQRIQGQKLAQNSTHVVTREGRFDIGRTFDVNGFEQFLQNAGSLIPLVLCKRFSYEGALMVQDNSLNITANSRPHLLWNYTRCRGIGKPSVQLSTQDL